MYACINRWRVSELEFEVQWTIRLLRNNYDIAQQQTVGFFGDLYQNFCYPIEMLRVYAGLRKVCQWQSK